MTIFVSSLEISSHCYRSLFDNVLVSFKYSFLLRIPTWTLFLTRIYFQYNALLPSSTVILHVQNYSSHFRWKNCLNFRKTTIQFDFLNTFIMILWRVYQKSTFITYRPFEIFGSKVTTIDFLWISHFLKSYSLFAI